MSSLLSVSLPDDLAADLDKMVEESGTTRSELVRETLRKELLLHRLKSLRDRTRLKAEAAGIGPDDVEDLIDQVRSEIY